MKKQTTIFYSAVGVVAVAGILIGVNVIAGAFKTRVDLTKEQAYTLSGGTRDILSKLESPVKIKLYCTQTESTADTVGLRGYAKDVEDLLSEYKQAGKGKVIIEKYDPQPDSDAEDSARMDGVEPQALRNGDRFYLGLAVSCGMDEKQAIPFLDPSRERLLEYDISRAITKVVKPEKPVVGVMSAMPVFGAPANPMMMRMGQQQQGQQPWAIITELKNDFAVKPVEMTTDRIDDSIKVLLVIHPREITESAQYAIDQFVLRGGKLVAFLDPLPMVDAKQQNPMMGNIPNSGSSLDKLLKAWGITFDTSKVVADMNFKMQLGGRNGEPQEAPACLSITSEGINTNDIATSQLDNVWLPYAGAFTGTPATGLIRTVLLKSTKDSQLVDGFMANMAADNIMKEFKASGTEYALAIKLTGKFKTAFPNGKPEARSDDDKKAEDKSAAKSDSLKESKVDGAVILVGDADMLFDNVAARQVNSFFGPMMVAMNGNFNFCQNAVEQMSGDSSLIAVRSRGVQNRPFTRIKAIEAAANEKFQTEIKSLEDKANEAQRRVNEMQQQKKDKDQRFVLSPEQQSELLKLRKDEAETRKHLKQVKKDLRKEVVSLQTRIKWINILVVPLAIAFSGIVMALIKRNQTSAK
jgi:ABC-type uncharacterized transport system involved in gliding motility auxiliary subunit